MSKRDADLEASTIIDNSLPRSILSDTPVANRRDKISSFFLSLLIEQDTHNRICAESNTNSDEKMTPSDHDDSNSDESINKGKCLDYLSYKYEYHSFYKPKLFRTK